MIRILLAGRDQASLSTFSSGLAKNDVQITWADSGNHGMSLLADSIVDLVVTDENLEDMTGLEFIKKIVSKNPMVNCAALSSLSPEEFHEASEGLGILMQLPIQPDQEQAEILLGHLKQILNRINFKSNT